MVYRYGGCIYNYLAYIKLRRHFSRSFYVESYKNVGIHNSDIYYKYWVAKQNLN